MIFTKEICDMGKSTNGGFSIKQLNVLGVREFSKDWAKDLYGKEIDDEIVEEFWSLKNRHLKIGW